MIKLVTHLLPMVITLHDTEELQFGAGGDLRIYHNGSHSFIREQGTGDLKIMSLQIFQ